MGWSHRLTHVKAKRKRNTHTKRWRNFDRASNAARWNGMLSSSIQRRNAHIDFLYILTDSSKMATGKVLRWCLIWFRGQIIVNSNIYLADSHAGKKGEKKMNRSFIDVGMPIDGHHHGGSFQPSKQHVTNSLPSTSLNKSAVVPYSRVVSPFLLFDQQGTWQSHELPSSYDHIRHIV